MPKKYTQRTDGEAFRIPRRGHIVACCDCGLVHLFKPLIRNGGVFLRAWRLPRNTIHRRKAMKILFRVKK